VSQENVETVRRLSNAFSGGTEGWLEFYSPDVELHRSNGGTVYRGPDGMERLVAEQMAKFSDLRWDRELLIDAGDRVVALFHQRGRSKDDGAWVEVLTAGVFSLKDGKITCVRSYESWSDALGSLHDSGG
jgi:ketosteroid isomerase-like protein